MCLWYLRNDIPKHILRYRSDVDVDDPEQLEKADRELWNRVHEIDADTKAEEWILENCRRFRRHDSGNMRCFGLFPDDYVEPEFEYND